MPIHFKETKAKSVGQYLRELRKNRKLDLNQISKKTKIKIRYIEAIEADKIDTLIQIPYARISVLKYGRMLDADINKLLQLFDKQYVDKSGRKKSVSTSSQNGNDNKKLLISSKILSVAGVIIIIGGLFYLGLYINNNLNLQRDILNRESDSTYSTSQQDSTAKLSTEINSKIINYKTKDYVKKHIAQDGKNLWYTKPVFLKKNNNNYETSN